MNTRLNAVMIAVALVTLVMAVMWANIPTYRSGTEIEFDAVIWNDRQLVQFILTRESGTSMTMFEAAYGTAGRLLGGWVASRPRVTERVTIVRYEDGVVTQTSTDWSGHPYPLFVEGQPYMMGGVWTGKQLATIASDEWLRITRKREAPGDFGEWRRETMLFRRSHAAALDLPVRVSEETMSMRATRSGDKFTVDLVRKQASPLRLWSASTAGRSVSAAEFERLFQQSSGFSPGRR